jgi:hypothetical protein
MRIDVYTNGDALPATNAYFTNGNMYLRDPSTNIASYMPTYSNASGTNLFVKSASKVYFSLKGSDYVDLKIGPVLVLKFGMPAVTINEFFDKDKIVANFAALLDIDASKIRQVNIVRATNSGRRRRGTSDDDTIYVTLTIFENPAPLIDDTDLYESIVNRLNEIEANTTNRYVTGQLNDDAMELFNVSLSNLFVQRVESNSTLVEINQIDSFKILTEPSDCREQSPCGVQPYILVLDKNVPLNILEIKLFIQDLILTFHS